MALQGGKAGSSSTSSESKKRTRTEGEAEGGEESFPVLCISGDVDVTKPITSAAADSKAGKSKKGDAGEWS